MADMTAIEYYDFHGSTQDEGNSFVAELLALTESLKYFKDALVDTTMFNIYTDSDSIVRIINDDKLRMSLVGEVVKNNGKKIKYQDLWAEFIELLNIIRSKTDINIRWVKGHSDQLGNQFADVLATLGLRYALAGVEGITHEVSPQQGYWKYEVEKNPLINLKRLYFRTDDTESKTIYMSNPKEDELIGRRLAESCYAVVNLATEDSVLNTVRSVYGSVMDQYSTLAMVRLDKLYSKRPHQYIAKHGIMALVQKFKKGKFMFNFLDDVLLTEELYPAALSIRAMENFEFLSEVLKNYTTGFSNTDIDYKLFDITDYFYTDETVNADLRLADRVKITKPFDLDGKEVMVDYYINLGIDVLERNSLKRLEKEGTRIYLVVWRSGPTVLNYGTILDCKLGNGIWSNYFSNKIYL
jgi:ribonuclease HI